jgi:RHS repeat-associated protein
LSAGANCGNTPALTPQSSSAFNANTNRLTTAWGHDAAGNITTDATARTFLYDAENRQTSYNTGNAMLNATYDYDGDGRRVRKLQNGKTTVWVYDAAGRLAAEYSDEIASNSGTTYVTADHLGSTRILTDAAGNVQSRTDYLPFGEEIASNWGNRSSIAGYTAVTSIRQKFTGKERDGESGLDFFGARYFSGAQGRFTSPDPLSILQEAESHEELGEFLSNPQHWNKYAYSLNNPLKYVDPDGRHPVLQFLQRLASSPTTQRLINYASTQGTRIYNAATRFFNSPTGQELTQGAIETVTQTQAPNMAPTPTSTVAKGAFEIAAEGGKHAGFLRNYLGKSAKELDRGIASLEKEIATHLDKIKNPGKYIEGFEKLDPRQQQALINKKWPSDIERQRDQLEILKRLREEQQGK